MRVPPVDGTMHGLMSSDFSLQSILLAVATCLVISLPAVWGTVALWFQAGPKAAGRNSWVMLWVLGSLGAMTAACFGHAALALFYFVLAFAVLLLWWRGIPPRNDRIWADDVARITHGVVEGQKVTLHNVRNFAWRTRTDYVQRWESRSYDLERLISTDMILSFWSGPAIAHMLISFGFEGGEQVAFSVEIRRELNEDFSEIGGFFKQFELSIIACDERDVVRVRTNVRREDAYLYRLRMPTTAMRSLFLGYLTQANALLHTPRFYNTITVNCTTLVYHMMQGIVGYLPLDWRVLFTGYLPTYVYRVGGLDDRYPLEELARLGHITERARAADQSAEFSADIRRGIPPLNSRGAA